MTRARLVRAALAGVALSAAAVPAANALSVPVRYENPNNPEHYVACVYLGPDIDGICVDPFAPWR
jgi:hypothetical protein